MKKKHFILLFLILLNISCFAQVNFEPGYYVDNNGQRIKGLIKNLDPVHNPHDIVFKDSENAENKILSVRDIQSFEINEVSKYVRFYVKIDRSSNELSHLSDHGAPDFEQDTLLLKCMIEGQASLYKYSEPKEKLLRFFYTVPNKNAEQLVYKMYRTKPTNLAINNNFRNQLRTGLGCESLTNFPYKKLTYKSGPLANYFIAYNTCKGSTYQDYYKKRQKPDININIRPGLTFTSPAVTSYIPITTEYEFEGNPGFRVGLELEYFLPFNRNKWAIIFEPTFQKYSGKAETFEGIIEADFNYLEFPLGLRYAIFLNDQSKIFLSIQYSFDATLNSNISFPYRGNVPLVNTASGIFGAGFQFKRYIIELRGTVNRNSLYRYPIYNSKYSYLSVVFGFNLF